MKKLMPEFNRVRVTQVKEEATEGLNLTFDLPADISVIKKQGDNDDY